MMIQSKAVESRASENGPCPGRRACCSKQRVETVTLQRDTEPETRTRRGSLAAARGRRGTVTATAVTGQCAASEFQKSAALRPGLMDFI